MPEGWPSAEDRTVLVAYGASKGLDVAIVTSEIEGMALWAASRGARMADWRAFGRNWLRRVSERPRGAQGPSRPVSKATPDGGVQFSPFRQIDRPDDYDYEASYRAAKLAVVNGGAR